MNKLDFLKMRRLMAKLKAEGAGVLPTTVRDGDILFTDGKANWYKRDAITGEITASGRNITVEGDEGC